VAGLFWSTLLNVTATSSTRGTWAGLYSVYADGNCSIPLTNGTVVADSGTFELEGPASNRGANAYNVLFYNTTDFTPNAEYPSYDVIVIEGNMWFGGQPYDRPFARSASRRPFVFQSPQIRAGTLPSDPPTSATSVLGIWGVECIFNMPFNTTTATPSGYASKVIEFAVAPSGGLQWRMNVRTWFSDNTCSGTADRVFDVPFAAVVLTGPSASVFNGVEATFSFGDGVLPEYGVIVTAGNGLTLGAPPMDGSRPTTPAARPTSVGPFMSPRVAFPEAASGSIVADGMEGSWSRAGLACGPHPAVAGLFWSTLLNVTATSSTRGTWAGLYSVYADGNCSIPLTNGTVVADSGTFELEGPASNRGANAYNVLFYNTTDFTPNAEYPSYDVIVIEGNMWFGGQPYDRPFARSASRRPFVFQSPQIRAGTLPSDPPTSATSVLGIWGVECIFNMPFNTTTATPSGYASKVIEFAVAPSGGLQWRMNVRTWFSDNTCSGTADRVFDVPFAAVVLTGPSASVFNGVEATFSFGDGVLPEYGVIVTAGNGLTLGAPPMDGSRPTTPAARPTSVGPFMSPRVAFPELFTSSPTLSPSTSAVGPFAPTSTPTSPPQAIATTSTRAPVPVSSPSLSPSVSPVSAFAPTLTPTPSPQVFAPTLTPTPVSQASGQSGESSSGDLGGGAIAGIVIFILVVVGFVVYGILIAVNILEKPAFLSDKSTTYAKNRGESSHSVLPNPTYVDHSNV